MSIQERTTPPKRLSQNLSATGTSMYLNDINDWDNTSSSEKLLSSSDFGTVVYAMLRNEARTQIELIEIDPATITAATSPITINKRALGYNGGTTAATETAYAWLANDTIVELGSDVPQLLSNYVNITDAQTVAGVKTFSSMPVGPSAAPTTDYQMANKKYADDLAIAGAPDMTLTVKGIGEEATAADINAGTQTGGTSAELIVNPKYLKDSIYYTQLPTADQKVAIAANGGTVSAANLLVSQQGYQEGSETYGEDSGGDDTYVITLSPAITSYTDGMNVTFEVTTTANTTACTLDAGGGAKSIKKYGDAGIQDLDTNDIQAGQAVLLIWSAANDCWIFSGAPMISKADATDLTDAGTTLLHSHPITSGYATKAVNNTADQTIAHGLGVVPKLVKITCIANSDTNINGFSIGTGTATNSERVLNTNCTSGTGDKSWSDETAIVWGHDNDANVEFKANLKTLDATNIVLEWTTNTAAGNTRLLIWEAYA